jgi:hypothetical protein
MRNKTPKTSQLLERVGSEFRSWFLPVVASRDSLEELAAADPNARVWIGFDGPGLAFVPAPPPIKKDPAARPYRLGMVNGRLKMLRTLPLSEKVTLAGRILDRMLEVADNVAVAFSGGRDSLVALHLTLQRRRDVKVCAGVGPGLGTKLA